jgi:hypothetical protein
MQKYKITATTRSPRWIISHEANVSSPRELILLPVGSAFPIHRDVSKLPWSNTIEIPSSLCSAEDTDLWLEIRLPPAGAVDRRVQIERCSAAVGRLFHLKYDVTVFKNTQPVALGQLSTLGKLEFVLTGK